MKNCLICGKELPPRKLRFCSSECANKYWAWQKRKQRRAVPRICTVCGREFEATGKHKRICPECYEKGITSRPVKGPGGTLAEIERQKMEAWEKEAARRWAEDQDPEAMKAVLRKYGYKV